MSLKSSLWSLRRISGFVLRQNKLQKVNDSPHCLTVPASMSSVDPRPMSTKAVIKEAEIKTNPFFEKYKAKIEHLKSTHPDEYEEKLRLLTEKFAPKPKTPEPEQVSQGKTYDKPIEVAPPSAEAQAGAGMTRSKGLDSVMKIELIQDKTPEEITKLWNEYHSHKECVYAVLTASEFNNLIEKSKECPVFVYPIPRNDGFEFILCQFDRNDVYFTPLSMFQVVRENAPPCLTVTHYPELKDSKGIVLMNGQHDPKVINQNLALNLVQQMSIFYGKNSKFFELVKRFNYQPEEFKYEELIDAIKSLPQCDLK